LLFIIYINDLLPTINTLSELIFFADDTVVIIYSKNFDDFSTLSNTVLSHMSKLFTFNKLVLNLNKTNIIKHITNKSPQYDFKIGYDEKYIEESINTKFFGLQIDNHLNWKNHIDLMILNDTYSIRSMSHIISTDTLKSIYFTYFHSIIKYGIIFGGNSPNSKMVFTLQNRTVRIIAGVKSRNSCRNLFMRLEILPLPSEYIFTLMNFVVNNQEHFHTNSAIHCVNTRNRDHFHRPTANLSYF
jgi:hypothetical protein